MKLFDPSINMKKESHTGLLLGTAAFFSGTAWQPIVNFAASCGMTFNPAFASATLVCMCFFMIGLRFARTVLPGMFE